MFNAISLEDLISVTGGCVIGRTDPRHPGHNGGITGGMDVPNNDVPSKKKKKPHNTGITGGLDVKNNDVP